MRKLLVTLVAVTVLAGLGATHAFAGTKSVAVADNYFSTSSVSIHKGSKVTWRWSHTDNRHNVTSKGHFHSKTSTSGTFSATFTKAGTYTVICTLHPTQMRMKVHVK
jgi:plastocyanin